MINQNLLLTGDDGYNLTKSLRFRSSASAYMNRTPASAGNRKTFTWSGWVKLGSTISNNGVLLSARTDDNNRDTFQFAAPNIQIVNVISGSATTNLVTTQVFRDPSAWYHIIFAVDTTQATSTNRVKVYINGSQITSFSTATYPSLNENFTVNAAVTTQQGALAYSSIQSYFDGYLTEVNFIDGQALTPSSFGSTNALTGVWQPAKYTGTYGTNGFYLPFTNTTSTTTLGYDFSGNSNNWTTNNLSLTTGSTYDSMTDVPTLTSATTANYCVLNPLDKGTSFSISNGNLTADINASRPVFASVKGTFGIASGKYYWEFVKTSSGSGLVQSGVWASDNLSVNVNTDLNGSLASLTNIGMFGATSSNSIIKTGLNTQDASTLGSYTNGDVIGIAFDADSGKLYAYKNGTEFTGQAIGSGTSILPTMATGKTYQPFVYSGNGGSGTESATTNINFGQRPFSYTPPTGFVALNTYNLPTSTIVKGNTVMDATIWSGDNTTPKSITNAASFKPDFVWLKSRSNAYQHNLYDSVRGAGAAYALSSDQTSAEGGNSSTYGYLSAFNSTGFQVTQGSAGGGGAPNGNAYTNQSGSTYVGWQWQAGQGTTSSNTSGSITSTVSVNASAGFSVVTYTGNNTLSTVGHGLGVSPKFIIVKTRSGNDNWVCYHGSLGVQYYTLLNTTASSYNNLSNYWSATAPSSSVFGINAYGGVNTNGATYVAYCWAEIAGFSKFGSYTGNGSSAGPFAYLGFRPRFLMLKRTDVSGDWIVIDTARGTYNSNTPYLNPNNANAENGLTGYWDLLSNGFKVTTTDTNWNNNGSPYIYMAFAENPFKNALAR